MVYLNADNLEGKTDIFGKDKMIQNVLTPNITKIATQAGLDPAGFKPDKDTMEQFYQTPFRSVMPDGSTYTPAYDYVVSAQQSLSQNHEQLWIPAERGYAASNSMKWMESDPLSLSAK